MHLFGETSGPHLAHFHAWHHGDRVELDWELRNSPPLKWRVLRSEDDFAENADAPGDTGQVLVSEGPDTHVADEGLKGNGHVFYTVFAQDDHGTWHRQAETRLKAHDAFSWLHPDVKQVYEAEQDMTANPPVNLSTLRFGSGTSTPYVRLEEWRGQSAD